MSEDKICPTPLDLVQFFPYACDKLQAPFSVVVSTRILDEYVSRASKCDKAKKNKSQKSMAHFGSQEKVSATEKKGTAKRFNDKDTVFVIVVVDTEGRVIELDLINTIVPSYFLKIFQLCILFHPKLNKITLRMCPISDKTICELSTILSKSQITELCLDKSPLAHCKCAALLQHQTHLASLSLNYCGLSDEDCEEIAVWLQHRRPPHHLRLLSMASNYIKDRGAVALATMLRSNRFLRYINIADNQVTDTGALAIFNSLIQFPLTRDEIITNKLQKFMYLRLYREVCSKLYYEALTSYNKKAFEDRSGGRKKTGVKHSNVKPAPVQNLDVDVFTAAAAATVDSIGPNDDPFSVNDTVYQDGHLYSIGNISLAYINISYNHIGVISILKLIEVMRYQANLRSGLVRVSVEGNALPTDSPDLLQLADLQRQAVARRTRVENTDRKYTYKR